jgi:c-di-GMP phosphodiesterase
MRLAQVKTDSSSKLVLVPITSSDKPEISEEIQKKWQKIVDLAAKIIGVPSGLVTRLHEKQLEVMLSSKTGGNIFEQNLKLELGLGWYCENVAGTRKPLVIPNAHESEYWSKDNPSIPFNMISYMGLPILWPDGEVFGTFCMLDNKEHRYPELYQELLESLREIIQNDLKAVLLYSIAQDDIVHKEIQLREVHHCVKNHFNLLITTLRLQSLFNKENNNVESLLADVQSRISVISVIHDRLYNSLNPEKVLLGDYISELGKHILNNLTGGNIKFNCESDNILVSTKVSVPCGLIVNELITNSLKYAFDKVVSPEIFIQINNPGGNMINIFYKDNGKGLPSQFNIDEVRTLGVTLVKHSVEQLDGTCEFTNRNGLNFTMKFGV